MLQERFGCEEYEIYASEEATGDGSDADVVAGVMIHDHPEPIGAWRAKSSRYAKIKAALSAAVELEGIPPFEFRARYGCDCRTKQSGGSGVVLAAADMNNVDPVGLVIEEGGEV